MKIFLVQCVACALRNTVSGGSSETMSYCRAGHRNTLRPLPVLTEITEIIDAKYCNRHRPLEHCEAAS
jgi:hypothetical protein